MLGEFWIGSLFLVFIGMCFIAHNIYRRKATRREKIIFGIGCAWITLALYMTFGVAGVVFVATIMVLASAEMHLKHFL